jgi:predicted RNA-binding Zn ribbon-like protein
VSSEAQQEIAALEAELLTSFVNTHDLEEKTDAIATPEQLRAWVAEATGEFLPGLDGDDVERVHALRESLREALRANNGGGASPERLAPMGEAIERSRFRLALADDGQLNLEPARSDLSGFEARLLLAIERTQCQGLWPRLKACTDEECRWAFFDTSRNRSRTWCSMDVCGNREKTRRYRQRKRSGS